MHGDIKGQNILIGEDGLKIADFGCSKLIHEDDDSVAGKFIFFGTHVYMAPEVSRGEEQGFAADIWSLGCTFIEMAMGCSPWPEIHDPKKRNPVAPAATIAEYIFNAAAPLSSDMGASALGASLEADVKEVKSFKFECLEVGKKVGNLCQMLRTAVGLSTSTIAGISFYDYPLHRITTEVSKNLEKSLVLLKKCKRRSMLYLHHQQIKNKVSLHLVLVLSTSSSSLSPSPSSTSGTRTCGIFKWKDSFISQILPLRNNSSAELTDPFPLNPFGDNLEQNSNLKDDPDSNFKKTSSYFEENGSTFSLDNMKCIGLAGTLKK
ncbi:Protein kinase domain-containing protein [Forsythia ovata]|uniref:Protein kinase domain-containing protein n=1 Tax=Forsythia ovata TaxID=205694 RepID=A0ABD1WSV7_9LAMI